MKAPTYVYFMKPVGLDGPIKVGYSNQPKARIETLATWSPWPLEFIGTVPGEMRDEMFLHTCFATQHSHHEWFHSSPDLLAAINAIIAAGTVDAVRAKLQPVGQIRPRLQRNPQMERRRSYRMRLTWVWRKIRKLDADSKYEEPRDVAAIMKRWYGGQDPTAAEIARIDSFLAEPNCAVAA